MKLLLFFVGLFFCCNTIGQIYEDAESLYFDGKHAEAEKAITTIIKNETYKNDLRLHQKSLNLLADLVLLKKDTTAATKILEDILHMEPAQQTDSVHRLQFNSEKYQACIQLFEFCIKKNNLQAAEKYLRLTKKYPYHSATGSDVDLEKISLRFNYAELFEKMNKPDSALIQLIPNLESHELCCEAGALAKVLRIIKNNYSKQKIKLIVEKTNKQVKNLTEILFADLAYLDVEHLVRGFPKEKGMSGTELWQTSYLYLELKKLAE